MQRIHTIRNVFFVYINTEIYNCVSHSFIEAHTAPGNTSTSAILPWQASVTSILQTCPQPNTWKSRGSKITIKHNSMKIGICCSHCKERDYSFFVLRNSNVFRSVLWSSWLLRDSCQHFISSVIPFVLVYYASLHLVEHTKL